MELNITNEGYNPALERKEIEFEVNTSVTPSRKEIKKKLAALKNTEEELVVIKYIKQLFGEHRAVGKAHIYKSAEMLKKVEPRYLLERGKKKEKDSSQAQKTDEQKR